MRHRGRLFRHRRMSGAQRPRHRVRLLRVRVRDRRQLALPQRQRHVLRLSLAPHQHLAADDGVQVVPDAGESAGLPLALPDRRVLRRLREAPRVPRPHPIPDRSRFGYRRFRWLFGHHARSRYGRGSFCSVPFGHRRERAPLVAASARTRLSRFVRRGGDARALLQDARAFRREEGAGSRHRQFRVRHRRRVVPGRFPDFSGDAAWSAHHAQVPVRHAHRSPDDLAARPVRARLAAGVVRPGDAAPGTGEAFFLRVAGAVARNSGRAPDGVRRSADPARARRHHREAERCPAGRIRGGFRRR